jgi:hypothetical protein
MRADLQQICPEQSLLSRQVLGHVAWQTPSQHKLPPVQSLDWVHAFGQGSYSGFRHKPATSALRFGSLFRAVVQHTSLFVVSHSVEVEQALGHCQGGRQMPSL